MDDEPSNEHFEGLGDKWEAILADLTVLFGKLPRILSEAQFVKSFAQTHLNGYEYALLLLWPDAVPPCVACLLAQETGGETNELISSYPILEGSEVPGTSTVATTYTWESGLEGEVTICTDAYGEIFFFDPFYYKNKQRYSSDTPQHFKIAALAFTLTKPEQKSFTR